MAPITSCNCKAKGAGPRPIKPKLLGVIMILCAVQPGKGMNKMGRKKSATSQSPCCSSNFWIHCDVGCPDYSTLRWESKKLVQAARVNPKFEKCRKSGKLSLSLLYWSTATSSKGFWLKIQLKQTISDWTYGTLTSHLHLFQSRQWHKHNCNAKGHRSEAY